MAGNAFPPAFYAVGQAKALPTSTLAAYSRAALEAELLRRDYRVKAGDEIGMDNPNRYSDVNKVTIIKIHGNLVKPEHHGKVFFVSGGTAYADTPDSVAARTNLPVEAFEKVITEEYTS